MGARRILAGVGIVLAAAAAAAPAVGAGTPRWLPAVPIMGQVDATPLAPGASLSAGGQALAVTGAWVGRPRPALPWAGRGWVVVASARPGLRAAWSRPSRLSAPAAAPGCTPAVAANARGDAVVVWREPGGRVESAVRRGPRGAWRILPVASGPLRANPWGACDSAFDFASPRVAVGPSGAAAVAWTTSAGPASPPTVHGAALPASGRAWRPAPDLAIPVTGPVALAVDGAGDLVAAWSGPEREALVALRPAAGRWEAPEALGRVSPPGWCDVALSGSGDAAATWADDSGVEVALRPDGAPGWSAPDAVAAGGTMPRVALDGRGDVLAAWTEGIAPAGGTWTLHGAARDGATGAWTASPVLASASAATGDDVPRAGEVVVGDDGTGAVEWADPAEAPGPAAAVVAVWRAGAWESQAAPGPVGDAVLALAPGPTGLLVGQGHEGFGPLAAASYDAAPAVSVRVTVRGRARPAPQVGDDWTIVVRNSGRVPARGVRLRIPADVASRVRVLRGHRPVGGYARWDLGTLGPGAGARAAAEARRAGLGHHRPGARRRAAGARGARPGGARRGTIGPENRRTVAVRQGAAEPRCGRLGMFGGDPGRRVRAQA